ncbi:PhzF family phenazine biosynthesis protein [Agromyces flavus]|uniref:Phenazine biosynthesis protein PhzF family n=1 Tax=Agromyces flavus TaxID=589382 RepID=A0A1H1L7Z9_9MICO|nr:PhzF family phenazine biosynthesis isomerase [Agromyces flavus]MCP2367468.1 PhzF family phenazine biosynthesis protein [Agromyces flavus]GGI45671.1 oxidoreductase [Agromyces flavus]SDR70731.1 phenazine biosynthesis protein PhzF family [Agromyces flavus]
MTHAPEILRYAAFTSDPAGGNPAGIVLEADDLDDVAMLRIAGEIGFAETAFISDGAAGPRRVRFFSPHAEVPFCGHATVAGAIAIAEREGTGHVRFSTPVGDVDIETSEVDGALRAAFTSVEPHVEEMPAPVLDALLGLTGIPAEALDERHPPRIAFAGNRHPVLVVADEVYFDRFAFDPAEARALMDEHGWPATITVLHRLPDAGSDEHPGLRFEARNIFPVGAIIEDPATGAAAAAVGGYLRALGAVEPPARVVIRQGRHVGRPSELVVDIPERGGTVVSGTAVPIG